MKKIFITGGAGFIGSAVTKKLLNKGYEVSIYDAFINYVLNDESINMKYLDRLEDYKSKIRIIRGDVRDKDLLKKSLGEEKPDIVVHLANMPIADLSNKNTDEAISSIFYSTINLLNIMLELNNINRLIYASSSMVYGDFQYVPCDENHLKNPKDVYGGAKLSSEIMIQTYARRFNLEYTIIRPSAVYGPTDINRRVSQIFIENAINNKSLILHNGGTTKLDFTYIDDIVEGIYLSIIKPIASNKIYNITRGEGRSLKEFTDILKNYFPSIKIKNEKSDIFRPERGSLDVSFAKKELGYISKYSLEEGIKKYLESINFNYK